MELESESIAALRTRFRPYFYVGVAIERLYDHLLCISSII
jgi:hypothetical protein